MSSNIWHFFLLNRWQILNNTSQSKWEQIYQWKLQKSSLPCASGCLVCEPLLLPDCLKFSIAKSYAILPNTVTHNTVKFNLSSTSSSSKFAPKHNFIIQPTVIYTSLYFPDKSSFWNVSYYKMILPWVLHGAVVIHSTALCRTQNYQHFINICH